MRILITGAAGFIGAHLARRCATAWPDQDVQVVGIDNFNDYYDVGLKKARVQWLADLPSVRVLAQDLTDKPSLDALFRECRFTHVVNLAAQAGVRHSIENPDAYVASNLVGFHNLLECCRHSPVAHLVYASSSSVYGLNTRMPFSVGHNVDHPVSLYAATKKSNELMAHVYSHLYRIPTTGLRFFTVYGPWGRPDMALFLFTKAILEDNPIKVFNHGQMRRDFTYIDDIVEGVCRVMTHIPASNPLWSGDAPDPASSPAPYQLFNIGNNNTASLMEFIEILEQTLGKPARKEFLPLQPGDVPATFADIDSLEAAVGFRPATRLADGIASFVAWYRQYYAV